MRPATRKIMVVVLGLFVLLLAAGVLASALAPGHRRGHAPAVAPPSRPTRVPAPAVSGTWVAVPPVTVVPDQTPVQQQYDQALAQGLASSSTAAAATSVPIPAPAVSSAWPALPVSYSPDQWARQFAAGLLDIDFARQSRPGLGAWLSAQEAPELLPGVPLALQNKVLYLSVVDPSLVGGGPTPIPSAAGWAADAKAAVRWSVGDLLVQPDPQWSQILAEGWQPIDERFGVEDVSGQLTVTGGGTSVTHRFSMCVYTSSAHWHDGYGTVLVDDWTES